VIEAEFEMSDQSARNFMKVAEQYGSKSQIVLSLPPTALYALASSAPEVQAEVERRIAAGELVSAGEIKSMKDEAKAIATDEPVMVGDAAPPALRRAVPAMLASDRRGPTTARLSGRTRRIARIRGTMLRPAKPSGRGRRRLWPY
jgi:hypothetical protein